MSEHTEGKLEVVGDNLRLVSEHGRELATVNRYYELWSDNKATADRFALTWNCHDDLLKALEGVMMFVNVTAGQLAYRKARTAIAKARNTPEQGEEE